MSNLYKGYLQVNHGRQVNKSAALLSGQVFPFLTRHGGIPSIFTELDIEAFNIDVDNEEFVQMAPGMVGVGARDGIIYAANVDGILTNTGLRLPDQLTQPLEADPNSAFWKPAFEAEAKREQEIREAANLVEGNSGKQD